MRVLIRFLALVLVVACLLLGPSAASLVAGAQLQGSPDALGVCVQMEMADSPAAQEGRAIPSSLQNRLRWRYDIKSPAAYRPIADVHGSVYLQSSGLLECVGADGGFRWILPTFACGGPASGEPAIGHDGTVYCVGYVGICPADNGPISIGSYGQSKGVFFGVNTEREFVLWIEAEGPFCSWPVVDAQGIAHCVLDGIGLVAIDPADYSISWVYDTGEDNHALDLPKISVDDKGVVYAGLDSKVHAVSPTGEALWVRDVHSPWDIGVPPETRYREEAGTWLPTPCVTCCQLGVYFGQSVYVAMGPAPLVALDHSGEVLWVKDIMSSWYAIPPAVGVDGELYVVDPSARIWRIEGSGHTKPFFSVEDMCRTYPGGAYEEMWRTVDPGHLVFEAKVVADRSGVVYVGALDTVWALEQDGSVRWAVELPALFCSATPSDADGVLYVTCDDGYLYAIDIV